MGYTLLTKIRKFFGLKKKKKQKVAKPIRSHYYERMFPPIKFGKPKKLRKVKQFRPPFPGGTFVYPDSWYDAWNNSLLNEGWTKKEVKQGWRWVEE